MSAFTESAFLKKLAELNPSQQSIQTLSLWLIHHRKHHIIIVRTWLRELQSIPEPRKLMYMYLANDVIQNSKKKGPEYGKEYMNALPKAFSHIGEACTSDRLFGNLGRILNIWEDRGVYDSKVIEEYRNALNNKRVTDTNSKAIASQVPEEKREGKRKHEECRPKPKKNRTSPANNTEDKQDHNGDGGEKSPYVPLGDPPEPEDLIKALIRIENSASSDAVIRERIANLPPDISELSCLSKLEDKAEAQKMAKQINEAVDLLTDYNARLAAEMEERTKLAVMLRDFQAEQKELLTAGAKRLEECKKMREKTLAIQKEIRDHLSNLPDLTQLPDVTGGLAPLPSAGDLFNIH